MGIFSRLLLSIFLLTALLLSMFGGTLYLLDMQRTDALVINLAGRQRMLSQKIAKEVLQRLCLPADHPDAAAVEKTAMKSRTVFERTLKALSAGGQAPASLDPAGVQVMLPSAADNVGAQLRLVGQEWNKYVELLDAPLKAPDKIVVQGNVVLASMNAAVDLMQANAESKHAMLEKMQLAGCALGLLLAAGAIYTLYQHLRVPLRKFHDFATAVSGGNFDVTLSGKFVHELGVLRSAMEVMLGSLRTTLDEARENAQKASISAMDSMQATMEASRALEQAENSRKDAMREAAEALQDMTAALKFAMEELCDQVEDVTNGAVRQEERSASTATAMEEMNASIVEVARNAEESASQAQAARDRAVSGADLVAQVVRSISDVEHKSNIMVAILERLGVQAEDIGRVMNVINDIADQTNLLALNAAIEAARAGDAGRGFAVVADEVRKLAEKTMTATKEVGAAVQGIQGLTKETRSEMEASTAAVGVSTRLAREAGASLTEIVGFVEETSARVAPIATASGEQTAASQSIAENMDDVARIAQGTTKGMQRSRTVLGEVSTLINRLNELINAMASGADLKTLAGKAVKSSENKSSSFFVWTDELNLGIPIIDQQHKVLFQMISDLFDAVSENRSKDALGGLLARLREYTVRHFGMEEEYFKRFGYEEIEAHMAYHHKLTDQVIDFEKKFNAGDGKIGPELLQFLKDWLIKHIMETDRKYVPFMKKHGVQ